MRALLVYIFILLVIILLVTYNQGTVGMLATLSQTTRKLVYWLTARDTNGNFVTVGVTS